MRLRADEDAIAPGDAEPLPPAGRIGSWALRQRETVALDDVAGDSHVPAELRASALRSLVTVPLHVTTSVHVIAIVQILRVVASSRKTSLVIAHSPFDTAEYVPLSAAFSACAMGAQTIAIAGTVHNATGGLIARG